MKRYSGIIIDITFVFAFLVIAPAFVKAMKTVAVGHSLAGFRLGLYASIIYPMACWAILQKITTTQGLCVGFRTFNSFLWRWYTWPFGIIFWLSIFAHGVAMPIMWGLFQPESLTPADNIISAVVIFISSCMILFMAWNIVKRLGWIKRETLFELTGATRQKAWQLLKKIILLIILSPLWVPIALLIILYFYLGVWIFAWITSDESKDIKKRRGFIFPDNWLTRTASSIILLLYTIVAAFYYEILSQNLVGMPWTQNEIYFGSAVAVIYFYIPFRFFFFLYAGRDILSYFAFAASVVFVYMKAVGLF